MERKSANETFDVVAYRELRETDKILGTVTARDGMKYRMIIDKKGRKIMIPTMKEREFKKLKSIES